MKRRAVYCPNPGRVTQPKLRAELEAAGVQLPAPASPLEPLDCHRPSPAEFVVVVVVGDDPDDAAVFDDAVRRVVAAHEADSALDALKAVKTASIDARTRALIAEGLRVGEVVFSLSLEAQSNWSSLYATRDRLTYPFEVSTLDDKGYNLPDAAAIEALYLAGTLHKKSLIDAGRELKQRVAAASTEEELERVRDERRLASEDRR